MSRRFKVPTSTIFAVTVLPSMVDGHCRLAAGTNDVTVATSKAIKASREVLASTDLVIVVVFGTNRFG
jgi:hypothetical protein